ncbi:class I SAM-dependent methyltransferase [Streptomyces sp. NBC_01795]|uniref:class I SAM-dependent methyltransferase n=1 Tax=unclassified Streptomyces TaxID=2593676 RepID=UPI002DD97562|nr:MULTISPECIES: class I SAM-dependent methyltransferase [unclassified Streptomyces]WSA93902.1 class I SAM-dependent methyltransferase [Streptomyces sp. NBC_01795]WSB78273.1 class I SAM-dependent methyltransferase [Streptomyces sp. NBC_01775]WSS13470.1 class I SAM-dependent methyltransferase [Streptomyces sp. NBC_01186]
MPSRAPSRPEGTITRGTTHPNRLRRMDRWLAAAHGPALRRSPTPPSAVDLGYGAAPWTAVELLERLRTVRPDVRVHGVEIDPERVAAARAYEREGLAFVQGGFEIPLPPGEAPRGVTLIRAANVLRQYAEGEVAPAWARLCARLAPDGLLIEGTCDEIGRRHVWVALGPEGPRTVTFAARLATLATPSDLAERLPKALIHRNVPGEPVHAFLHDFDRAWATAAPYGALSARQRWVRAVRALSTSWPLTDGPRRWRQGEVTVRWAALAPRGGPG